MLSSGKLQPFYLRRAFALKKLCGSDPAQGHRMGRPMSSPPAVFSRSPVGVGGDRSPSPPCCGPEQDWAPMAFLIRRIPDVQWLWLPGDAVLCSCILSPLKSAGLEQYNFFKKTISHMAVSHHDVSHDSVETAMVSKSI